MVKLNKDVQERMNELRGDYGNHETFKKLESAVAHINASLREGTFSYDYYTDTVFGHFEIAVGLRENPDKVLPECMCCGEAIKEVSPDEELCLECYDDVVDLACDEEIEPDVCGCGNFKEPIDQYCPRCEKEQESFEPDEFIGF